MKYSFGHICFVMFFLNCFYSLKAEQSYAQLSTPTTKPVQIERLNDPDGLLRTTVFSIAQDQQGFMWFGTGENGLIRYDGYEFIQFDHDPNDSTTVASGNINSILVDSYGKLWVGARNGLSRFDIETESFTRFNLDPSDSTGRSDFVQDILEDHMGYVWIATYGGLFRYNYKIDSLTRFTHDPEDPKSLGCDLVGDLYQDEQGILWIGTIGLDGNPSAAPCEGGLNRFDHETGTFQKYYYDSTPINNAIYSILEDSNGSFWVGAWNGGMGTVDGLFLFDRETGTFERGNFNLSELSDSNQLSIENPEICSNFECAAILTMYEDNDRGIWISNILGKGDIYRYDLESESVRHYNSTNSGLGGNDVTVINQSRDATLWFGTFTGVYKATMATNMFSELTRSTGESESLKGTSVKSMLEDQNNQIWIGTHQNGLYQLDSESRNLKNLETPAVRKINLGARSVTNLNLYEESNGVIWIGHGSINDDTVVHQYSPVTKLFKPLVSNPDKPTKRRIRGVRDLIRDKNGRYWVAAGGLYLFDQEENKATFYRPSLPDTTELFDEVIHKLFLDGEGIVWAGSDSGLFQLIDEEEMSTRKFLTDRVVVDLFEDRDGRFWVGTWGDGLHLFDSETGQSTKYGSDDGLSSDKVAGILEDDEGFIWLSTAEGTEFIPQKGELSRLNPDDGSITIFSRQNGLPEVGFHSGSTLKTSDGKLYFGGNGGVVYFDPESIKEPSRVPPTMILTGLWIQNEKVSPGQGSVLNTTVSQADEIQLSHIQNDITLSYAGLSYRDPDRTQYEYMMEGFDEEWVQAGTQRSIRYSGLPAGSYTFRARGLTSHGVWSVEDATLGITVLPPWWRTWWAYALYALLFAAGVFAVDRYQRQRLIKRERERARERELEQQKAHAREIQQAYQNLETAHENLKSAQDQLIQQEKLASLGQLTAGIAHEIKNPLNFVNNFSDVSIELVDEARDELKLIKSLKSTSADEIAEEIATILTDIEANLRKIHEHGSRADRIVKSMLQHSGGGKGERQLTDLNVLIKEYVHLSYHGMRAGPNPIDCEIDLELDERVDEVEINPEEMSRVIMNLCKNAFDAMSMKAKVKSGKGEEYSPILKIRTSQTHRNIMIDVEDNGAGIPEKIRGNILQPFFTTKKGTEGTGLGLSISSNVVKAHGGDIRIESVEDNYSIFKIVIPIVTPKV